MKCRECCLERYRILLKMACCLERYRMLLKMADRFEADAKEARIEASYMLDEANRIEREQLNLPAGHLGRDP